MKYYYEIYENNIGEIFMVCFKENGTCIYFANLDEKRPEEIWDMIEEIESGANPRKWEGNSKDPEKDYDELTDFSGAELIADSDGIYYDCMRLNGKEIFLHTRVNMYI